MLISVGVTDFMLASACLGCGSEESGVMPLEKMGVLVKVRRGVVGVCLRVNEKEDLRMGLGEVHLGDLERN